MMSLLQTIFLGAIAGFTIYLGLPFARIPGVSKKTRTFLSMISAGILLFLFFDIFGQLAEPIESALDQKNFYEFALFLAIFIFGFGIGLLGLIGFEQRFLQIRSNSNPVLSSVRLALMIAVGIGLHNFSEGLAIGQSAGSGQVAFAVVLILGFGLHNATEGFGIVGPLVGIEQPSWKFLGLAGLIGGGPTFIGTLIGYYLTSQAMSILFLSLAAGALVYILGELFNLNRQPGLKLHAGSGLFVGLSLAFVTDLILVAAGI
jgi:zinc transporter, ZIP family